MVDILDYHIWYGGPDAWEEVPGGCPEVCFPSAEEAQAGIDSLVAQGGDWAETEYEYRHAQDCPCQRRAAGNQREWPRQPNQRRRRQHGL